MPTQTPEERLSLIEQALFSPEPDFSDVLSASLPSEPAESLYDECSCDCCQAPPSFEEALHTAQTDGVLVAYDALILIAQSGVNADAVAASEALLEFSLTPSE